MKNGTVIIIPARMASSRLPGKPLMPIAGRTLIERVCRIARAVAHVDSIAVATDDADLARHVAGLGINAVMTSSDCRTGTDRVAEASQKLTPAPEIVLCLQGDAVLTPPWVIEALVDCMLNDPQAQIATPAVSLKDQALADFMASKKQGSSSGTCVVFDANGYAMYFSKGLIPYAREAASAQVYRHIGLYAYRTKTLQQLTKLPEGRLERIEKLEQLRALEAGIPIRIVEVDYRGRTHASVDNLEDIARAERIIAREGELVP